MVKGHPTDGSAVETLWWDVKLVLYYLVFITVAFLFFAILVRLSPQLRSDLHTSSDDLIFMVVFLSMGWILFLVNARVVKLGGNWISVCPVVRLWRQETRIPLSFIKSIVIELPKRRGDGHPLIYINVQDAAVSYTLFISIETSTRLQNILAAKGINVTID